MVSTAPDEEIKRLLVFAAACAPTRQLCNALSHTPLLMVVAEDDRLTPTDLAIDAYQRAILRRWWTSKADTSMPVRSRD
jgi:predicted esterase